MAPDIKNKIDVINISTEELTLFEWKPPRSFRSFILDLRFIRENSTNDIFFHINKGNMKIVHIKKSKLIYTIGSDQDLQFQILEAILEYIAKKFNETYDIEVIFSYGDVNASIFKDFTGIIKEIIENLKNLDLVEKVDCFCRVCKKSLPLYIKKSIMKTATSFPVPIVYNHKGHAIICYVDQNFAVRGVELANITG